MTQQCLQPKKKKINTTIEKITNLYLYAFKEEGSRESRPDENLMNTLSYKELCKRSKKKKKTEREREREREREKRERDRNKEKEMKRNNALHRQ